MYFPAYAEPRAPRSGPQVYVTLPSQDAIHGLEAIYRDGAVCGYLSACERGEGISMYVCMHSSGTVFTEYAPFVAV